MKTNSYSIIFNSLSSPTKLLLKEQALIDDFTSELSLAQLISQIDDIDILNPKALKIYTLDQLQIEGFNWIKLEDLIELPKDQGVYLCQALAHLWPGMPHCISSVEDKIQLPKFLYKISANQNVAFFGGSFNPWHEGHTACLELSPTDNIIIVPDYNPWKAHESNHELDESCRWKTLRELAMRFKNTSFSIYPGFWGIKTPNPTYNWMKQVQYENKSLIIGDDNFVSFEKWADAKKLVDLLEFIYIIPRILDLDKIESKKQELEDYFACKKFRIMKEHEFQHISSTEIRKKLYQQ